MTTNSQLSANEPKKRKTMNTKQTTRTGIESAKWISLRAFSVGRGRGGIGEGTGKKKHNW